MAERSSGLVAALVAVVVLTAAAFCFMFAVGIETGLKKQIIAVRRTDVDKLAIKKEVREQELRGRSTRLEKSEEVRASLKEKEKDVEGWRDTALQMADEAQKKIEPAVGELNNMVRERFGALGDVLKAMEDSREAFEADEKNLIETIRMKTNVLSRTRGQFKERAKALDTEIAHTKARLTELKHRLERVRAEAMRGKTISDAGGSIIAVGSPGTNFVVIGLGSADRIRRGLKFLVWAPSRGHGLGWVQVRGEDFLKKGTLPGDWLVVGRGDEVERYPVVSVGISRKAEEKGLGLARHPGKDTFKIMGVGVTDTFSVVGLEWKIERATEVKPLEELGAVVKGMIEITKVHRHSSEGVILPERLRNPVCPQCGWEAYDSDMRYCPFCFRGDNDDEVQRLDTTVKAVLNKAQDRFLPILVGDRLSNPYFSPTLELIFVLGSQPVRRTRQHMKAFIEYNGGKVVEAEALLTRPEVSAAEITVREVMPYEVNYVVPGKGPDADALLKRARELGIRLMREDDLYEFFGELLD